MIEKKLEKFALRILFKYQNTESEARREIMYIYNRESLNSEINLKKHAESNQEFIEIGDILTLEGNECKVVNITFYLSEKWIIWNTGTEQTYFLQQNLQTTIVK